MQSPLRVIHTSDWHLGRMLYGKKRNDEFERFLAWLSGILEERGINVLLVAGDIFDTTVPTIRAQEAYYKFLCGVAKSNCRHVVITGGNHDSAAFLDAPGSILKFLDIHVVGSCSTENPAEEVLLLRDASGDPELIVGAVPFLRDRDMRKTNPGESLEDKELKLAAGIRQHYAETASEVERIREREGDNIPAICMGHLFTDGGKTVDGDGVRNLYVGSLANITADIFSPQFDYVALGHLHMPQTVGGLEHIRYSGSPIAMGFNEAAQTKSVCQIEFSGRERKITTLEVPVFQKMETIRGDELAIYKRIGELAFTGGNGGAWLEIIHTGETSIDNLRMNLEKLLQDSDMEILRLRDERIFNRILTGARAGETLRELNEEEVFRRLLDANNIEGERRESLMTTYREALLGYLEANENPE